MCNEKNHLLHCAGYRDPVGFDLRRNECGAGAPGFLSGRSKYATVFDTGHDFGRRCHTGRHCHDGAYHGPEKGDSPPAQTDQGNREGGEKPAHHADQG